MRNLLLICLLFTGPLAAADESHPGAEEFVQRVAGEHDLDPEYVREMLAEARFEQSIIDAITRPAEGKPWHAYRPIFLDAPRIDGGVEFWRANAELLAEVEERFGVAREVVVAIVGVETRFGMITGNYRVLDALATLGFYYPRRSEFFSSELGHYLRLAHEEDLPITDVKGSYAGAMGLGQFMPSSYREYAVDFDGSGRRDLWRSLPDVLGSVANYLAAHGWEVGGPLARPVADMPDDLGADFGRNPRYTVGELRDAGVEFDDTGLDSDRPADVLALEGAEGPEHWLVLNNFYVLTRYNRSPLYAMAVTQLAEEIRARRAANGGTAR